MGGMREPTTGRTSGSAVRRAVGVVRFTWFGAVATTASCGFGSPSAAPVAEACSEDQRRELMAEKLTIDTPSQAFTVGEVGSTWVGLIADTDYSVSALFPTLADVYLVPNGVAPDIRREGELQLLSTDDLRIGFDAEGNFQQLDVSPGEYRLWSYRSPEIAVVSCPEELAFRGKTVS